MMPGMDGFALAEQIKAHPELARGTIMMLTSGERQGDTTRCRELGVASYLTKPLKSSELFNAIVKVLGDAPAMAMGNLYQATAQALSNSAHNATTAQQQNSITAQAATTMGVATLYSLDTASTGEATRAILSTKVKGL